MEEELEKPKVIEDPKLKNLKRIKRFSLIILAILIVSTVISSIYYLLGQKNFLTEIPLSNLNAQASPTPALAAADKIVAKVGRENIYQADINYYLSLYFPTALTDVARYQEFADQAFEKVIEDSIILQEGEKANLIKLNPTTFNNLDKNYSERNKLVETALTKLEDNYVDKLGAEAVNIWFNNDSYPPPSIGMDQAKVIAKQKIDKLYEDIKAKKITIFQAGQQVRNDKSLASIDPSYKSNAYILFSDKERSDKLFNNTKINDSIWELKKGEISTVMLVGGIGLDNKTYTEFLYTIVQVTDRKGGQYPDSETMIKGLKGKYEISRL